MAAKKIALISDFDGTITKEDFFHMVSARLLAKDSLAPWKDYLAGRVTHIAALNAIFSQIRVTRGEMDRFIASIPVDRAFYNTLKICGRLKIPVYICSAGSDYYIKKRIGKYIKEYNIRVVANGGCYSPESGLRMSAPPKTSPFYDKNLGVSKHAVVKALRGEGYFTVFAGDGKPDILAAKEADTVFARDMLAELCKADKVPFIELATFKDIGDYLKGIYGAK